MLRALYVVFGLLVIAGYAYVSWNGLELIRRRQQQLSPQGVRATQSGGGVYYRGGYRGGK